MNLSFDIHTKEGDSIIVSLSSYYSIKELVGPEFDNVEIAEVSIFRQNGNRPVSLAVFGKIADILISIAEENPETILYYFCDITEEIPHSRAGHGLPSHDYRNELFKRLFERYQKRANDHWSDIEIILMSDEPILKLYAHFLLRDKHLPLVEALRSEVQNNFKTITGQK